MKKIIPLTVILVVAIGLLVWIASEKISAYKMSRHDILVKAQTQQAVSMLEVVYEGYREGMYSLDEAKSLAVKYPFS